MSTEGGDRPSIMASAASAPYPPTTAQLGEVPTLSVDGPICAVLMVLFLAGAAANMIIFQVNRRRDHKFLFSALLFGFCMARTTTLALRLAWAARPHDVRLAIAAGIFVQAGVVLLFVINLIFAQRLVRSYHPSFGWSRGLGVAFRVLYFCVGASLIMVITASVYMFYTLDPAARQRCRQVQLFAGTFLTLLAFLPVPITVITIRIPRAQRPEKFGQGRCRTKISLLLATSLLLSLGAVFRLAVNFAPPRPLANPGWYHSKPCFYGFDMVLEILVVYLYAASRFDRRFHVPDGASQPGHYSGMRLPVAPSSRRPSGSSESAFAVNREVDVFGDDGTEWEAMRLQSDWEARAIEELNKAARLELA